MKTCRTCRIPKEETKFYKSKEGYLDAYCKSCQREYRKANPRDPGEVREHWLRSRYNFSSTGYKKLLEEQSGKCKICEEVMIKPNIDHCHRTDKVRGLLCQPCNAAIGLLKDSPKNCVSAARYLKMARYLK